MKAIKISPENNTAIVAALKAVNGRADRHAFTTFQDVEGLVTQANSRLAKTLLPKSEHKGARVTAVSGDAVCNAYAKKGFLRAATSVILECRSTGWFITAIAPATVNQSGGWQRLVLTPAQKEIALARFAATLHPASGSHMTITFQRVINGFYFTGVAEVEPAEAATEITPGSPTIVTVWNLHLDGSPKDCIDIIDPAVIQRIEQMIVEAL